MTGAGAVRLLTFGHGTADQAEVLGLLSGAGVGLVVDVRRFPGSRRFPHVGRDRLAQWLPDAGIAYRWDERLGGRRRSPDGRATGGGDPDALRTGSQRADPVQADPAPTDPWWRVESFRAYAAHTRTPVFGEAMVELLADARRVTTVVMCSESLWWRCHRRLISDVAVLLHGVDVRHLDHRGGLTEHPVSAGARRTPAGLVYDGSS